MRSLNLSRKQRTFPTLTIIAAIFFTIGQSAQGMSGSTSKTGCAEWEIYPSAPNMMRAAPDTNVVYMRYNFRFDSQDPLRLVVSGQAPDTRYFGFNVYRMDTQFRIRNAYLPDTELVGKSGGRHQDFRFTVGGENHKSAAISRHIAIGPQPQLMHLHPQERELYRTGAWTEDQRKELPIQKVIDLELWYRVYLPEDLKSQTKNELFRGGLRRVQSADPFAYLGEVDFSPALGVTLDNQQVKTMRPAASLQLGNVDLPTIKAFDIANQPIACVPKAEAPDRQNGYVAGYNDIQYGLRIAKINETPESTERIDFYHTAGGGQYPNGDNQYLMASFVQRFETERRDFAIVRILPPRIPQDARYWSLCAVKGATQANWCIGDSDVLVQDDGFAYFLVFNKDSFKTFDTIEPLPDESFEDALARLEQEDSQRLAQFLRDIEGLELNLIPVGYQTHVALLYRNLLTHPNFSGNPTGRVPEYSRTSFETKVASLSHGLKPEKIAELRERLTDEYRAIHYLGSATPQGVFCNSAEDVISGRCMETL